MKYFENIQSYIDNFQREPLENEILNIIDSLKDDTAGVDSSEMISILEALKRKRHFDLMCSLADTFLVHVSKPIKVKRYYAQALIDSGMLYQAKLFLTECLDDLDEETSGERNELYGLMGRTYKQLFVETQITGDKTAFLESALNFYGVPYLSDQSNVWHGINIAALRKRAERDGIEATFSLSAEEIADDIIEKLGKKESANIWDYSTLGEAYLVKENFAKALEYYQKYSRDPDADAFELNSSLRQLKEIWNLDPKNPLHAILLGELQEHLLQKEGGGIVLDDTITKQQEHPEFAQFEFLATGASLAKCVARVKHKTSGVFAGTGFLIPGKALSEQLEDKLYFMTNNHVVNDKSGDPGALKASKCIVEFDKLDTETYHLKTMIAESSLFEYDYSLFELDKDIDPDLINYEIADKGGIPKARRNDRVFIIGHPDGKSLSYSINNNLLVAGNKLKLHYKASTLKGSSGSPVFNKNWDLVALHHYGSDAVSKLDESGETYSVNEGIHIHAVIKDIRGKLS